MFEPHPARGITIESGQIKLSLTQKGSKNRERQRLKIAKLHEKTANQRKDFRGKNLFMHWICEEYRRMKMLN